MIRRLFNWRNGFIILVALIGTSLIMADTCSGPPPASSAQQQALDKASKNQVYIPKNNVELNNYNSRQKIADDPTTILWCTSAFPIPSSPLFTVPILGKLTSGSKRPFSTSQAEVVYEGSSTYSPELPGPDGMYGPSDSYRYGFTPGGIYVEFSGAMETYCTTEPTVWQRQSTTIVLSPDKGLLAAQEQCQQLQASKAANANAQCQAILVAAAK